MPALGESPEEFEVFLEELRQALAPQDAFENLLVGDMAEIHWHLRRLIRGEAGQRADHRCRQQVLDDELDARQEAGKLHELEPWVAKKLGLVWLRDSPVKFQQVIDFLRMIDQEVQQKGFQGAGPAFLKCLYGSQPGLRGLKLIAGYEVCLKDERAAIQLVDKLDRGETEDAGATDSEGGCGDALDAADVNPPGSYRAEFHKLIADEIAWFEQRAARHLQALADIKIVRTEAALEIDEKSRVSLINQERLERLFDRKWKLLTAYRKSRTAAPGCPSPAVSSPRSDL